MAGEEPARNSSSGTVHGTVVQAGRIDAVHLRAVLGTGWSVAAGMMGGLLSAGASVLFVVASKQSVELAVVVPVVAVAWSLGFLVPWWLVRRRSRQHTLSSEELHALRMEIREQWLAEARARGLNEPRPLRLRWRPPSRAVQARFSNDRITQPGLAEGDRVHPSNDPRLAGHELLEAFLAANQEQLVVLGEPGAGKSTLALEFVLAALHRDDPVEPVPVLLSIDSWDPRKETVEDWMVRTLPMHYPVLTGEHPRHLLREGRVLPVLDGLDEIHPAPGAPDTGAEGVLTTAFEQLRSYAGRRRRIVLTCRSAEYETAVLEVGALPHARVVEIEPVSVEDMRVYLEQPEIEGTNRWSDVIETITRAPEGPLARLLSTPFMINMIRRTYQSPSTRPGELTGLASAQDGEDQVLRAYLPAVYPEPRYRARAQRWLMFLAHHLHDRVGDTNLYWWHLARAVPRWAMAVIITGAFIVVLCIPSAAVLIAAWSGFLLDIPIVEWLDSLDGPLLNILLPPELLLSVVALALPLAVMVGARAGRIAHTVGKPAQARPVSRALRGTAQDFTTFCLAFFGINSALLLLGEMLGADAMIQLLVVTTSSSSSAQTGVLTALIVVAGVALSVSAFVNTLGPRNGGIPRRNAPRMRALLPNLLTGTVVGFVPAAGLLATLLAQDAPAPEEIAAILLLGLPLFAIIIGVPLGFAYWLATPTPQRVAHSPRSMLRDDRTALLLTAGGGGLATFSLLGLVFHNTSPPALGMQIAFFAGYMVAIAVLFGSDNAWLLHTVARFWLAAWGCLPWRLHRFLDHAAGEVLRRAGPAYQLRHDRLRVHLARQWKPVRPNVAETALRKYRPRRGTKRTLLIATAILAALFIATAVAVYPDGPRRVVISAETPAAGHGLYVKSLALDTATHTWVGMGSDTPEKPEMCQVAVGDLRTGKHTTSSFPSPGEESCSIRGNRTGTKFLLDTTSWDGSPPNTVLIEGECSVFDTTTLSLIHSSQTRERCSFLNDDTWFTEHNGVLRVWSADRPEPLNMPELALRDLRASYYDGVLDRDRRTLATIDESDNVRTRDLETGQEWSVKIPIWGHGLDMAFMPDGRVRVVVQYGNLITVWDVTRDHARKVANLFDANNLADSLNLSADGRTVANTHSIASPHSVGIQTWDIAP